MRILRVIGSVDPETGGPVEGMYRSSAILARLGHETEVVTLDPPSSPFILDCPFPVHPCGPGMRKYGYTPRLARWIATNGRRFDFAIIHGLWNHSSIGGWRGLRQSGLPYFVFTHGMMDPWFRQTAPVKHIAKQIFWLIAQGKVLRDAEAVLFTSEAEMEFARGSFIGPSYRETVIAYGSSDVPNRLEAQLDGLAASLPRLGNRRFILFLGRIDRKKGCDLLILAFSRIAERAPNLDLVLAGPDHFGLRDQLQQIAEDTGIGDRLHWPGMLSGDSKWGALRAAEAFILPSHQENFGIAVAEAMSCGTPVLISDKVNICREVAQSGAGLVEPDTVDGATRLLQRWFDMNDAEREVMGQRARLSFERHFSIERATHHLVELISQHCASQRLDIDTRITS